MGFYGEMSYSKLNYCELEILIIKRKLLEGQTDEKLTAK